MKQTLITLLVVVIIIVLGIVLLGNGDEIEAPEPDDNGEDNGEQQADVPDGWLTYSEAGSDITFRYPSEATTTIEAGRVKVTFIGPDSEMNTEITDGFTFFVRTLDLEEGETLEEMAERRFEDETEILEPVQEPRQSSVGERSAYEFRTQSQLGGDIAFVIMEAEGESVFDISYSVMDPNNVGYTETIETMMQTVGVSL